MPRRIRTFASVAPILANIVRILRTIEGRFSGGKRKPLPSSSSSCGSGATWGSNGEIRHMGEVGEVGLFALLTSEENGGKQWGVGGINSVGRVSASQAECRRFEPGIPLPETI